MGERIRIESLEPWTRSRCLSHVARARAEGIHTLVTCGARTVAEQFAEYTKGRELLPSGAWVEVGKVVTRALPEKAAHVRAAAYDLWLLWPTEPGRVAPFRLATMDERDGWTPQQIAEQEIDWRKLVAIGKELGLVCGADFSFRDWPHFENPRWRELPMPSQP